MQSLDHEKNAWVNWWGWISILEFLANDNTRSVTNMTHNSAARWLTSSDFFQWDLGIRTHLFSNVDFPDDPAQLESLTVPKIADKLWSKNFGVKKFHCQKNMIMSHNLCHLPPYGDTGKKVCPNDWTPMDKLIAETGKKKY